MSGEYDHLIVDNTTRPEDIQLAEVETLKNRQACTGQAETEFFTFKNVIGVTEGKELLNEIKAVKINIRDAGVDDVIEIQKVPGIMLQNEEFKKYFKPRELSIGPIHAADPNLFKKALKLKLAAYFFKECTEAKDGYSLLEKIENQIEDIKTCFDDEVIKSYADDKLILLLFLDGCAMLGFIHCFVNQRLNELGISNGQAALIRQDLFLLENQIPFKVLDLLMVADCSQPIYHRPIEKSQKYFFKFIITSNMTNFPRDLKDLKRIFKKIDRDKNPVHVLDLLRDVITADGVCTFNCLSFIKLLLAIFCSCGLALPLVICNCVCKCFCSKVRRVPKEWSKKQSFRSVQELKTAGISFKQNHNTLREISFHSRLCITGRLNLPTLAVNNSTQCMLLNLLALEMCFSGSNSNLDPWITSYVNLLDLLIDNEQDVKDLRAANILRNCLSSDAEAARMINSIGSYCSAPSKDTYAYVKKKIQKHHRRKLAIWMAQVCHNHFSSPWTILALFGAMAMLVLTAIQTVSDLEKNKEKCCIRISKFESRLLS